MATNVVKLTNFKNDNLSEQIAIQRVTGYAGNKYDKSYRPMRQTTTVERIAKNEQPRRPRRKKLTKAQKFWRAWGETIKAVAIIAIIVTSVVITTIKICNFKNNNRMRDYGRDKVFTTYTVKHGDTVWSISRDMCILNPEYPNTGKYAAEIMNSNHLNYNGDIKSGDMLILPYFVNFDENTGDIYEKYGIDPNRHLDKDN